MTHFLTTLAALATFCLWTLVVAATGMWAERKRAERAQRLRIARLVRDMQRPQQPRRPEPSETVRKAAQA